MERTRPDDDARPPDPAPASDPVPTPRLPKRRGGDQDTRPETLADNTKVTPMDDGEAIEDGIEVKET